MWQRCRNRVEASLAPGVATANPADRQERARDGAMPLQRAERIGGAGRLEATGVAEPRAEDEPVAAHTGHQQARRRGAHGAAGRATARNRVSSSERASRRNASEAALGKTARSNGACKRTTHLPASSAAAYRSPASG